MLQRIFTYTYRAYESTSSSEEVNSYVRPKRNQYKRQKVSYAEAASTTEESMSEEEEDVDVNKIEKILSSRDGEDGKEYLIKYENRSYIHTKWETEAEVLDHDYGKRKINTFTKKKSDIYVNPKWSIPERILNDREIIVDENVQKQYLVKFHLLGYSESCWESAELLEEKYPDLVELYNKINKHPTDEQIKEGVRSPARDTAEFIEDFPVPEWKAEGYNLRDYQETGFRWLVYSWFNRRNTILADEMGLGKTIQSISIMHWLKTKKDVRGPYLVISPMSCLDQWKREIELWTDLNAIVYHGDKASRESIIENEFHFPNLHISKDSQAIKNIYKFDVLITTYQLALRESDIIGKPFWKYMIVDEAHRLKNRTSKLFEALVNYRYDQCVLLTGTPIQNEIQELWNLLSFLEPDTFDSYEDFEQKYGDLKTKNQVSELQQILKPYMLRRMKHDVALSIPQKEETLKSVDLTAIQKQYYRAIVDRNRDFLRAGSKSRRGPALRNILMEQRKLCNHPYLIDNVEEQLTEELKEEKEIDNVLIKCSAKFILLDKLLTKLKENGHKVLIFSQMVRLLNVLETFLETKHYDYERLDGGIGRIERQKGIDRFNADPDCFVFLLSTKAGGLGLNLTSADTVVIFDSDWNPQNDIQAQARCHRIGQTKNVKIYRLITKGTYEVKMFDVASKKLGLNRAVLGNSFFAPSVESFELDNKDVESLLKHGAYELYKQDESTVKNLEEQMINEDIDSILARSENVVYNEAGVMNFSSATFVPKENINSENNEDFWENLLPALNNANDLKQRINRKLENDDEARAEFMDELVSLVDRILDSVKGKSHFSARGPLLELTVLISSVHDSPYFTSDDKSLAQSELERIEVITGKSSGTRSGAVSSRSRRSKGGDVYKPPDRLKKRKKESRDPNAWNKTQLNNLKRYMLQYGFGRWELIREEGKLVKTKTIEQVRSFAENMVSQIFFLGNLKQSIQEKINTARAKETKTTKSKEFVRPVEHGIEFADKAMEMTIQQEKSLFKELLEGFNLEIQSSIKVIVNEETANINSLKFKKLGKKMVDDESLYESQQVFASKSITLEITTPGPGDYFVVFDLSKNRKKASKIMRQFHINSEEMGESQQELTFPVPGFLGKYYIRLYTIQDGNLVLYGKSLRLYVVSHPLLESSEFIESFQSTFKTYQKKLMMLMHLQQVIDPDTGNINENINIPLVKTKIPVWWWEPHHHDVILLRALWKYGFGVQKMKEDYGFDSEEFSDYLAGRAKSIKEDIEVDAWPTTSALNQRCYRIMGELLKKKRISY
eukprot:TRINITY_DN3240_c0_g1_i2.p1 TRINITY_DN3240_c0_g1~~TRINITY_DN3240_c0_g1_i2.p1  ORF type:complete len:1296 (+),score=340.60 TRINITY_DN3240_c0_g1_i2:261-4148(+)